MTLDEKLLNTKVLELINIYNCYIGHFPFEKVLVNTSYKIMNLT
jgi:hypothetical protein